MTRPDLDNVPEFYKTYVSYVQEMDLFDALKHADEQVQQLIAAIPEEKGDYRYAGDKWTLKEVLNHMMDTERVFAYRALRFARNDKTALHAFAQDDYAHEANAHNRTIKQLGAEMHRLRQTTIDLFSAFTPDMLQRQGVASNKSISVLNLGYVIAGHDLHHRKIVMERYLNL